MTGGASGGRKTDLAPRSRRFWIESIQNHERDRFQKFSAGCGPKTGFHFSSSRSSGAALPVSRVLALERVPIKWNHLIDKDALEIKNLEHVLMSHRIYAMSKYRKSRATFSGHALA